MKIFLTGATGLLGRRLVVDRLSRGDTLVVLSRNADAAGRMFAADVNPNVEVVEGNAAHPGAWQKWVDGCDAVIHLAGAGIADHRWTASYKKELANSRIDSTHQVVNAIGEATQRPSILINGSAVGYYGNSGSQFVDESHPPGTDFLADVCVRWEEQALLAEREGARVVLLRTGVALDHRGGALKKMLGPFRAFIGGPLGLRRHWQSWIHWRDWVELVDFALSRPDLSGPVNCTAPNPVTNWELARTIGQTLGRPWWFAAPKPVLRVVLGEAANAIVVSQRVLPQRALDGGYTFVYGQIEPAIEDLLGQPSGRSGVSITQATATAASHASGLTSDSSASAQSKKTQPTERVRLLAVDVEGALLGSDRTVTERVRDACRRAQEAGCVVVPATGHAPQMLRQFVDQLGITAPIIAYHGALIWNPVDRAPQHHQALDPELVRAMIDEARSIEPNVMVGLEVLDRWFTDRVDRSLLDATPAFAEPDDVGPIEQYLHQPVTRLDLFGRPEQLERLAPAIKQRYWMTRQVALYELQPTRMQLLHPMADKSIALQRVAARLGAARTQVMAIGEALNDAGMMEWAGFAVAVDNACEKVRHLADVTVAGNDHDGVAEAIERFVLTAGAPAAAGP